MLAWRITRPAPAEYRLLESVELELPEPGPGELRVKVEACGVCHTDLHEVEGDIPLPRLPTTPGHEIVGVIDALGPDVTAPALGTRVGIPWLASTCGECRFCLSGRENLCEHARFTGLHVDGGYAEYAVARADFVYSLPAGLDPARTAPLMCAGVIGLRAIRPCLPLDSSNPRSRSGRPATSLESFRVGLFGFGASAHLCLQIARHWSCEVAVFTRSPEHQWLARDLGAAWVGTADDTPPWLLDGGAIFAPAGELVPKALARLDRGGTLVLAGIHSSPIPELEYSLVYGERTVRTVANSTRQDVRDLLALAAEVPLRATIETFPFASAADALLAVKQSRVRAAAVLTLP